MSPTLLRALARVLHLVLYGAMLILLLRSVLSWVGPGPWMNHPWGRLLRRLTDPVFRVVHRLMPWWVQGGIDWSPVALLLALSLLDEWLVTTLLRWAARLALPEAGALWPNV